MVENGPPVEEPKPPKRKRLRRRWIALIVVAAVIVVVVVASFVTAHYTSRSSFCDSCHEMNPYFASWQASSHSKAECRDCHIPPGFIPYVKTKFFSFREVWVHITSNAEPPLAVTREIPNNSCLRCHQTPKVINLGNASFSHEIHQGRFCIACHVRIVHRDVNPPYYKSPGAMSSCLECHKGAVAPSQCSTCHVPGHEPRGGCSTCHNTESWTGAAGEHPFPRTGGHVGLACTDCHVNKPGVEKIPGTDLAKAPNQCSGCHTPPHETRGECSSCHTVDSFAGAASNHPFALTGAHASLACADCHVSRPGVEMIPGTQLAKADPACISCHGDHHGGLTDCASCHTPEGWLPTTFQHARVGEHMPNGEVHLECSQCHTSGFTSSTCSCHDGGGAGGD